MNKKRKTRLFVFDLLVYAVVYCFSLFFSTAGSLFTPNKDKLVFVVVFLFSAVVISVMRLLFNIYNNLWRYAGAKIYLKLVIADLISFCIIFAVRYLIPYLSVGFGVTGIMVSLNCLAALSMRFSYQILYARKNTNDVSAEVRSHRINIAIAGAGNIGASLADELIRNPQAHYKPICFIDVDKTKIGQKLNGLPIYAEDGNIIKKIKKLPVQEIVIAMPDIDGIKREQLYNLYRETGCKVKIYDYPLGAEDANVEKRSLRELSIEDLLARESIKFDNTLSKNYYKDKTVLITGGGGSIGSELCRQIAKLSPKKIVIFDIYENNAYDIQQEFVRKYGSKLDFEAIIGSVRDVKRLDEVFAEVRPQVVLHAAAHKHVPLMEKSAAEAIKNNVFGTYNAANMAEKYGVEKFVLISTDKAVNPTNIMGASKRICEMVVQCRKDSATKFVAVRFGNVLGSNGSVIPLFKKQIDEGGPITVTDKRIIRYFMTIPEAAQLVLQAGAMAKRGELFVLNMGKPVKIYDLALNMIRLSGLKPGEDIEIKEVGLRPGEKLYEELLIESETLSKTENELIFIERDKPFTREEIEDDLARLRVALDGAANEGVVAAVKEIVPNFCDPDEVNNRPITNKLLTENKMN